MASVGDLSDTDLYERWEWEKVQDEHPPNEVLIASLEREAKSRGFNLRDVVYSLGITAARIFDPDLHPRGRDGRFIEKLGLIELFGLGGNVKDGRRGTVVDITPDPKAPGRPVIKVRVDNPTTGKTEMYVDVRPENIQQAPEAKARLNLPNTANVPEGGVPEGGLPTTGTGTKDDPIRTGDPTEAAQAMGEGKYVELDQPSTASVLLDKIKEMTDDAKAKGEQAPTYDLCLATVAGTNLFCSETKNIPRIRMPQLKTDNPEPGSFAATLPLDDRGEADGAAAFVDYLKGRGINVTEDIVPADTLRPSQNELNGAKVAGIMQFIEGGGQLDGKIFVTSDDYVVDGHHRWAAQVGAGIVDESNLDIAVDRIDAPILQVLAIANNWTTANGFPHAEVAHIEGTNGPDTGDALPEGPFTVVDEAVPAPDASVPYVELPDGVGGEPPPDLDIADIRDGQQGAREDSYEGDTFREELIAGQTVESLAARRMQEEPDLTEQEARGHAWGYLNPDWEPGAPAPEGEVRDSNFYANEGEDAEYDAQYPPRKPDAEAPAAAPDTDAGVDVNTTMTRGEDLKPGDVIDFGDGDGTLEVDGIVPANTDDNETDQPMVMLRDIQGNPMQLVAMDEQVPVLAPGSPSSDEAGTPGISPEDQLTGMKLDTPEGISIPEGAPEIVGRMEEFLAAHPEIQDDDTQYGIMDAEGGIAPDPDKADMWDATLNNLDKVQGFNELSPQDQDEFASMVTELRDGYASGAPETPGSTSDDADFAQLVDDSKTMKDRRALTDAEWAFYEKDLGISREDVGPKGEEFLYWANRGVNPVDGTGYTPGTEPDQPEEWSGDPYVENALNDYFNAPISGPDARPAREKQVQALDSLAAEDAIAEANKEPDVTDEQMAEMINTPPGQRTQSLVQADIDSLETDIEALTEGNPEFADELAYELDSIKEAIDVANENDDLEARTQAVRDLADLRDRYERGGGSDDDLPAPTSRDDFGTGSQPGGSPPSPNQLAADLGQADYDNPEIDFDIDNANIGNEVEDYLREKPEFADLSDDDMFDAVQGYIAGYEEGELGEKGPEGPGPESPSTTVEPVFDGEEWYTFDDATKQWFDERGNPLTPDEADYIIGDNANPVEGEPVGAPEGDSPPDIEVRPTKDGRFGIFEGGFLMSVDDNKFDTQEEAQAAADKWNTELAGERESLTPIEPLAPGEVKKVSARNASGDVMDFTIEDVPDAERAKPKKNQLYIVNNEGEMQTAKVTSISGGKAFGDIGDQIHGEITPDMIIGKSSLKTPAGEDAGPDQFTPEQADKFFPESKDPIGDLMAKAGASIDGDQVVGEPGDFQGSAVKLLDGSDSPIGAKVESVRDGKVGEVVGYDKNDSYVKVKFDGDPKTYARSKRTLVTPFPKGPLPPAENPTGPTPVPSSTPDNVPGNDVTPGDEVSFEFEGRKVKGTVGPDGRIEFKTTASERESMGLGPTASIDNRDAVNAKVTKAAPAAPAAQAEAPTAPAAPNAPSILDSNWGDPEVKKQLDATDAIFREEGVQYSVEGLMDTRSDRLASEIAFALENGDQDITLKPPSGTEQQIPLAVAIAWAKAHGIKVAAPKA
jgi:hypothetical protein